jgi:hypothetical protein
MLDLIGRLVQQTPLRLIDGGNRFDPYRCSRVVAAALAPGECLDALLKRIQIARAFTCYQMLTLLSELPASPFPVLALDLLATFYDESVPAPEAERLLSECVSHLRRLSAQAPVVVSIGPPRSRSPAGERLALGKILQAAAQRVWTVEDLSTPDLQLSFFPPRQD